MFNSRSGVLRDMNKLFYIELPLFRATGTYNGDDLKPIGEVDFGDWLTFSETFLVVFEYAKLCLTV